ncbi:MAG: HEAT repeat domain-containing protein [Deltaproteobacteria bacterium]|nr:HEAT repeat domain-containing protein [Deltaproteobacteria bacterium]
MNDLDLLQTTPSRFKPRFIAVALALILGGAACKGAPEKLTVEKRMETQRQTFLLPRSEQLPQWRKWASEATTDEDLRSEALIQVGLLEDPEGVAVVTQALESPSHKLRGVCAQVLAHFGAKAAASAVPGLQKALKEANESDRRQIVWALVELGDQSVFNAAIEAYKAGDLTHVERLSGGVAFDPMRLANLVPVDELAGKFEDSSPAVRQLVATVLSSKADPKFTDKLIKLVQDSELAVAREAASGLGKIGDEKARGPLLEALRKADADSRQKFLEALRDGIGGVGLVLALDTVVTDKEERNWFQLKQLFEILHILGDPRIGDALVDWVERAKPHPHWRAEAGIALAEVGDVRGAKYIAERMNLAPESIYQKEKIWQSDKGGHLLRGDEQRTVAGRMLADLTAIHPDKAAELRKLAEEAVLKWSVDRKQPSANALRFLAGVKSEKALPELRQWAFPTATLPRAGAQPPMPMEFETAHGALRYVGMMKDESSKSKLLEQFDRKKDKKMDITQEGLMGSGLALLGMVLRGLTVGAAEGVAEWGPDIAKDAVDKLIEFSEDKTWHEDGRERACAAVGWIGDDAAIKKVIEKFGKYAGSKDPKDQVVAACFAVTLTRRPQPAALPLLVDALDSKVEVGVRNYIARAIGVTGLKGSTTEIEKLFKKLDDPEVRTFAALALIMGGDPDVASRAVASYGKPDSQSALEDLKNMYFNAYGYWSDKDVDNGNLYRWVENAEALRRVKINDAPQEWARELLKRQFDNLTFNNGPHSETKPVLLNRLYRAAKSGDAATKVNAVRTLKFIGTGTIGVTGAQGTLMALKDEKSEVGEIAARAFQELMNPATAGIEQVKNIQTTKDTKGRE